ncbi:MAG TPA: UDP-N-acetylmuramoyl-L-alanyl-D-glutamate--2,6-diaminopimelate ligase [Bacteroidales bacterium]|nr:UDP-N-acetylmuramoyl-L-alanyl-D-glutamate--2,6-diaminopimelate ligase [Bacteroidales bacterium]HRZ48276.1 UDP-N-acetylmuramoyl-L-alanyl-D-glutamate--2,6-diaminopimelate ligase [Bacteroidales bacterium]
MKILKNILPSLPHAEVTGNPAVAIGHLVMDSRKVTPGDLYAAIRGTHTDGHLYIAQAVTAGAVAVLCETVPDNPSPEAVWIRVPDSASALGHLASAFYDHPSHALSLIGVTGTNGKTTIATLLYNLFTALGYRCGLISTIRYIAGQVSTDATHTTPDAIRLHKMLKEMADDGCDYCFMEVSSHSVSQKRIAGLHFGGGIFSNLTHDHLDFHGSFDAYLKAKQGFFDLLPKGAFALTTRDDKNGMVVVQHTRAQVHTYSTKSMADFHTRIIENTIEGLHVEINGKAIWLRLTGSFNARNITAIFGAAMLLGMDEDQVLEIMSILEPVEGRFQMIRGAGSITAIVDYAHTPDALENVLSTLREVCPDDGKIITVVGAGGNRDPFKRPEMGKIAAAMSDRVIFTSDNPRDEDPELILQQIREGVNPSDASRVLVIPNRKEAIRTAVMLAAANDVVLVAGKGHEKYQEVAGVRYPFDDTEVLHEFLDQMIQP